METRAAELLFGLRNSSMSVEVKTTMLTKLKSEIKQKNVPHAALADLFESLRLAIASQHSSLSSGGFSALGHLIKRLYLQDQLQAIIHQGRSSYPLLLEKLGDHKERVRSQAAQSFTDFWPAAPSEVEHAVLEQALTGKNPRAKQTSVTWLVKMSQDHGLLFRAFVPSLVACLEDADSGVRDTAKAAVIDLFQNAPPRAVSDLKKQIQSLGVRKSIATAIYSSLGINALSDAEMSSSTQPHSRPEVARPMSSFSNYRREDAPRSNSVLSMRSQVNTNTGYATQSKPPKPETSKQLPHAASVESFHDPNAEIDNNNDVTEPMDVSTSRELDDMIRNMSPCFEGKESEKNWVVREKNIIILRRLTKGNAPVDFQAHYLAGIKTLLDGILKTAHSLRTTLSSTACALIQEIARVNGPSIDPMVEILLQSLIKLCAALKKIAAQNGCITVDTIVGNVTYTSRIMQHLWGACQDKNVQPRQHATVWLKTIMTRHGKHKNAVEQSGGVDVIEKCVNKGLADANPGVREGMRGTFWVFASAWPERAQAILANLDTKSRALLEKDPGNPNASRNPNSGGSRLESRNANQSPSRISLKEAIASQKRARLEARRNNIPPRPESALSTFSEAKSSKLVVQAPPLPSSSVRTMHAGAHTSSQSGSLSSAPMRPAIRPRRPELMRPATADPYSRRNASVATTQPKGPNSETSQQKMKPKASTQIPHARNSPIRPKSRLNQTANSSESRPASSTSTPTSHRKSHSSTQNRPVYRPPTAMEPENLPLSPMQRNEDFTAVLPHVPSPSPTEALVNITYNDSKDFHLSRPGGLLSISSENGFDTQPRAGQEADLSATRLLSPLQKKAGGDMSPVNIPLPHSRDNSLEELSSSPLLIPSVSKAEDLNPRTPQTPKVVNQVISAAPAEATKNVLKVYEDPQSPQSKDSAQTSPQSDKSTGEIAKVKPLEELPLNGPPGTNRKYNQEVQIRQSLSTSPSLPNLGENFHRRWKKVEISERRRSLSPRSKDPARAGDMIDRGLVKIQSGAMDVHGYRKFQSLVRFHESILNEEQRYSRILLVLLESLESTDVSNSSKSLDLKTQILFTVRLMLSQNKELFAAYYARAMTAIITARKHYEITNHIVSGLEETAEDIASACNPPEVIDAILDLLESEEASAKGCRMISMGSYVLTGLLRRLNEKNMYLAGTEIGRLGKFANKSLRNAQPDVRRSIMDFCLELHEMVKPEDKFWSMINSTSEDFRPILTYYIMRKPARA